MFGPFKKWNDKTRQSSRRARQKLQCESLEQRMLLAGDVMAAVVGTDLVITGDDAGNAVLIRGTTTPGQFIVSRADLSTTINGLTTPFTATGVTGSVDVSMGNGSDRFNLVNASISGGLAIDMGSTDASSDRLTVSAVRVGGTMGLDTGDGADILALSALSVGGATSINTRAGNDKVALSYGRFGSTLDVTTGDGRDVVNLASCTLRGDTTIDTGTENDFVVISASRFEAATSVSLGDGDDKLVVVSNRFDSTLTADGGAGTNTRVTRSNRYLGGPPTFTNFQQFPWA